MPDELLTDNENTPLPDGHIRSGDTSLQLSVLDKYVDDMLAPLFAEASAKLQELCKTAADTHKIVESLGSLAISNEILLQLLPISREILGKVNSQTESQNHSLEPIVRDLAGLVFNIDSVLGEEVSPELSTFRSSLSTILDRYGAEFQSPELGGTFSASEARAVGTDPTSDPAQDGCVSRVVRRGCTFMGKRLSYPQVCVFKKPTIQAKPTDL